MLVEILTPERSIYKGMAESLTLDAVDGRLQVLNGHIPYINILAPGEILLQKEDNTCLHFKHNGGVLEVSPGKSSVLLKPLLE